MYFVYLLECADKTFYIGSTNNLKRRITEHNHAKRGAHYTKIRRPVILKYYEVYSTLHEARSREAELKRLPKQKKAALLTGFEAHDL